MSGLAGFAACRLRFRVAAYEVWDKRGLRRDADQPARTATSVLDPAVAGSRDDLSYDFIGIRRRCVIARTFRHAGSGAAR